MCVNKTVNTLSDKCSYYCVVQYCRQSTEIFQRHYKHRQVYELSHFTMLMVQLNANYSYSLIVDGMRDYQATPARDTLHSAFQTHTILSVSHVNAVLLEVPLNVCGNKSNIQRIEIQLFFISTFISARCFSFLVDSRIQRLVKDVETTFNFTVIQCLSIQN